MSDTITAAAEEKYTQLKEILRVSGGGGIAIALSGGVDSSLLAFAAHDALSAPIFALTFVTELTPDGECAQAEEIAAMLGIDWQTAALPVLAIPQVAQNRRDRCYHCKLGLFRHLLDFAAQRGLAMVADGVNADDLTTYRPGNQAALELGVRHPLAEAGLTKAEIRALARRLGLPNHARPASPCLASRFPYDTPLDTTMLARAAQGEACLAELGLNDFRLRCHGELARIEALPVDFTLLLARREEIIAALRELGFQHIALDLAGLRSGSFDVASGN